MFGLFLSTPIVSNQSTILYFLHVFPPSNETALSRYIISSPFSETNILFSLLIKFEFIKLLNPMFKKSKDK